jgi:uncharacterized protein YndB with AHSA1/START domain
MNKPEFVYTTSIRTTPERLWQGLTDPAFTRRCWHGIVFESDWKPGWQCCVAPDPGMLKTQPQLIRWPW